MKRIHIEKSEFERVLALGSQCISPSKALPLSEFIRISVRGYDMKVEAVNEFSSIRVYGGLDIESEEASFCVNCKDFSNFVKAVPDDDVTLLLEDNYVSIVHSKGDCSFPTVPAQDFPEATKIDPNEELATFKMQASVLNRWIGYAKDFCSQDELRPNISGIHIYCYNGSVGFCATNQTTLVTDEYEDGECKDTKTDFIVNNKAFSSIVSILKDVEEVTVSVASNNVILATDRLKLYIRKTTAAYPNFRALFANLPEEHITMRRAELLDSLKRLNLCCNSKLKRIDLELSDGRCTLVHNNIIDNKKVKEDIAYEGRCSLVIGFVLDNLARAVSNADTEEIDIAITNEKKPVFIAEHGDDANVSKKFLICPSIAR